MMSVMSVIGVKLSRVAFVLCTTCYNESTCDVSNKREVELHSYYVQLLTTSLRVMAIIGVKLSRVTFVLPATCYESLCDVNNKSYVKWCCIRTMCNLLGVYV